MNTTKTLEERFEFHSEREAYRAGFREALDACREKLMSEVRIGNLDLSNPGGWENGYNASLLSSLSAIDSLRNVGGKEAGV